MSSSEEFTASMLYTIAGYLIVCWLESKKESCQKIEICSLLTPEVFLLEIDDIEERLSIGFEPKCTKINCKPFSIIS